MDFGFVASILNRPQTRGQQQADRKQWWCSGYNLSSWLAEPGVLGTKPGLTTTISEIEYLLLLSHDMTEIMLKKQS